MNKEYIVSVPSQEAFVEANEDIKFKVNALCSDVNDILSNISSLAYDLTLLDSSLIGGIGDFPNLGDGSDLQKEIDSIAEYVSERVLYIFALLPKFEAVIKEIDEKGQVDIELFNIKVDWKDFAKWGTKALGELSEKSHAFGAIGFLLNYVMNIDSSQDLLGQAGDDIFSDGNAAMIASFIWQQIRGVVKSSKIAGASTPMWINAPVGGIVAAIGVGLVEIINHEGVWEDLDTQRVIAAMTSAFGNAITSTVVASYAAGKLGATLGAYAGPVGAVLGAIAGFGVGLFIDWASAYLIGDDSVDKYIVVYDEDGNARVVEWSKDEEERLKAEGLAYNIYEVPRNGLGDNGSYDVIVDRFKNSANDRFRIGNDVFSESNFADLMYTDKWYDTVISYGANKDMVDKESFEYFLQDLLSRDFANEEQCIAFVNSYRVCDFNDWEKIRAFETLEQVRGVTSFDPWTYYKYMKNREAN